MSPRVTVLLAAYDGAAYVGRQIDSILAQDYDNLALVLSDDGSDDGTPDILDAYAARFPDRVTRHVAGRRFGGAKAHFAHLLESVPPGYVMFSDQDDVWLPFKVSLTMEAMRRLEEACPGAPVLVHTDLAVVGADLSEWSPSFMRFSGIDGTRTRLPNLLIQNVVTGCTVLVNAPLCELARGTLEAPEVRMHDWWLALAAAAFGRVGFVPRATMLYRQHGANSVGAKNVTDWRYVASRLRPGAAGALIALSMRQAGAFADAFSKDGAARLSPRDEAMCRAFCACETRGRAARAACYIKYGIYKCGAARIAAQFLIK